MKRAITLAAAASAVFLVSACGTTGKQVLDNVSKDCARRYIGAINGGMMGGNFSGTVDIDCNAHMRNPPPTTAPAFGVVPDLAPPSAPKL